MAHSYKPSILGAWNKMIKSINQVGATNQVSETVTQHKKKNPLLNQKKKIK